MSEFTFRPIADHERSQIMAHLELLFQRTELDKQLSALKK